MSTNHLYCIFKSELGYEKYSYLLLKKQEQYLMKRLTPCGDFGWHSKTPKKFTMSVKRLKSYIGGCQFCQLLIPIYFSDCLDSYLNIFSNMSSIIIVNFNSVTFTSPTWQTNELSYIVTQKQLPTKLRPREQENYFIIHKNWPPRIQMIP